MSLVTISRGSYHKGKEVAEKVAEKIGYDCLGREFLIEASEQFNIPEVKLISALDDAPGFFDQLTFGKDKFVAYIRNALLERMSNDNIVYHGLAGQFFLRNISNVLKVRIISNRENRMQDRMERDGVSEKEAAKAVKKIDDTRKKWSLYFYGIEIDDPGLYDLIINVSDLTVEDSAEIISSAVGLPRFETTAESKKQFDDLLVASRAKAAIVNSYPNATIAAKDGVVVVSKEGVLIQETTFEEKIKEALKDVKGVNKVVTKIWPIAEPY